MIVPDEIRLVEIAALCLILNRSRASVYRDMKRDPAFPRPFRLAGGRSVRWRMSEILAYIEKCEAVNTSSSHDALAERDE